MNRAAIRWVAAVALPLIVHAGQTARADILPTMVRGMELLGFQFSGEHNLLGKGLTITMAPRNQFQQFFNQRYDFGIANLTLNGPLRNSVGYTMRLVPKVTYGLNTGGLPLEYEFNTGIGAGYLTVEGSVLINVATEINALGFYDQTVYISNRGTYKVDQLVGPDDSGPTDYDLGPINRSGHLYADGLALLTKPLVADPINPFTWFSNQATHVAAMTQTAEELRARIEAGEMLSDEEMATLVGASLFSEMLTNEEPDPAHALPDLNEPQVAEPAALSLFVCALGMLGLRRRRRRPTIRSR